MTSHEVLSRVLEAGGRVIPDPSGPQLAVPRSLKPLVEAHREELRQFLAEEWSPRPRTVSGAEPGPTLGLARLLAMRLDVFTREGQPVEIRVPWWPATLFFVPDVRHAEALSREGIERARVWTAAELVQLLEGVPWNAEALRIVMVARREFGGEVVQVRARG